MPQIVEYTNKEGLQPTDRGTEARVQEGRRVGAFFNQQAESLRDFGNRTAQEIGGAVRDAGDAAVQYAEHREIGQGIGTFALMQDQLTNQWNDLAKNADPNDPSVRQKFIEENLTPALQKWSDTFQTEGGQKFAQIHTRDLLNHMYEKTAADMGTLAAQAVTNNVRTVSTTKTNTAYNDPSSVDYLLGSVDTSVGALVDSSPNLKGAPAGRAKTELAEKLKEGIVKAGAQGAISKSSDPEKTAEDWVRRYPQYITGDEAKTLAANARVQIRAQRADDAYARTIQRQDQQERSDQAEDKVLQNLYSDDPKRQAKVSPKSIVNDPDLTPEKKKQLLGLVEREMKPETNKRVSAQTTVDLLRKLRDQNVDLDKVMNDAWDARLKDPGLKGSLTESDFNTVRNEIIGRKTPQGAALASDRNEFFKQYARTIDPAMDTQGGHSQAGAQAMYLAEMDARRQEQLLGVKAHELYDPRSPNYFGDPKNLDKYRRSGSLQENNKARAAEANGGVTYVKPPPFEPMAGGRPSTFNERFTFDPAKPPAEREAGRTYPTPRGPMKWTGTGWVQP